MRVEVVPHHPNWCEDFERESQQIGIALDMVAIHHIGSTSIPTIYAKPIIDILVEVSDIDLVDDRNSALQALGYEAMGEFGIPGRRYFRKDNEAGVRTHHVHIFTAGSDQVLRHLAFRDYLRVHFDAAQQYSELKQTLAQQYPNDREAYMDGKDDFIQAIDRKAAVWQQGQIVSNGVYNY